MKILVINAGSSSLKYQLIDTDNEAVLAKGNCERIGQNGAFIGFKTPDGKKINRKTQMLNHTQAFEAVKNALIDPEYGVSGGAGVSLSFGISGCGVDTECSVLSALSGCSAGCAACPVSETV